MIKAFEIDTVGGNARYFSRRVTYVTPATAAYETCENLTDRGAQALHDAGERRRRMRSIGSGFCSLGYGSPPSARSPGVMLYGGTKRGRCPSRSKARTGSPCSRDCMARGIRRSGISSCARPTRITGRPEVLPTPRARDRRRGRMADCLPLTFSAGPDRAHPRLSFFHLRIFGDGAKLWDRDADPVRAGDRLPEISRTWRRAGRAPVSVVQLQCDRCDIGGRFPPFLVRRDFGRDRSSLVPGRWGNAAIASAGAALCFATVYPTFNDAVVAAHPAGVGARDTLSAIVNPAPAFAQLLGWHVAPTYLVVPWSPFIVALGAPLMIGATFGLIELRGAPFPVSGVARSPLRVLPARLSGRLPPRGDVARLRHRDVLDLLGSRTATYTREPR